jgi:hypothetical protein
MPTPWYLQFSWFLFEVNNTVAPIITVLFYTLLTPSKYKCSVVFTIQSFIRHISVDTVRIASQFFRLHLHAHKQYPQELT